MKSIFSLLKPKKTRLKRAYRTTVKALEFACILYQVFMFAKRVETLPICRDSVNSGSFATITVNCNELHRKKRRH